MQANTVHITKDNSVRLAAWGCVTPLGDAVGTTAALLRGERALRAVPVLGTRGRRSGARWRCWMTRAR